MERQTTQETNPAIARAMPIATLADPRAEALRRRIRKAVYDDGLTFRQAAMRLGIDGPEMRRLLGHG